MKFEQTELEGLTIDYETLSEIMNHAGFYPVYDYERVTFDYKMVDANNDDTYYFRVQAYAIEGEIPSPHCTVKLMKPILGKHYYPHGVEYDEDFPDKVIKRCEEKINTIKKALQAENVSIK